jgi:hypothetical protein
VVADLHFQIIGHKRNAAIINTKYQFDIARHDFGFPLAASKKRAIGRCKNNKNASYRQQSNNIGRALT